MVCDVDFTVYQNRFSTAARAIVFLFAFTKKKPILYGVFKIKT